MRTHTILQSLIFYKILLTTAGLIGIVALNRYMNNRRLKSMWQNTKPSFIKKYGLYMLVIIITFILSGSLCR